MHLSVDAMYELPVAFSVTKASNSEKTEMKKLLDKITVTFIAYMTMAKAKVICLSWA